MQISFLIGKQILSAQGDLLGYAVRALLNKTRTKILSLVCADENEEEFYLPARALHMEGDAIVYTGRGNGDTIGQPCPVGMRVFSETGADMGAVRDMIFDDGGAFLLLTNDNTPYPVSCARFGQVIILRQSSKPTKKPGAHKTTQEETEPKTKKIPVPTGLPDRVNLLGRTVKKTLYSQSGILIAQAGERITPETIAAARGENKLLQLAVNTLTNIAELTG